MDAKSPAIKQNLQLALWAIMDNQGRQGEWLARKLGVSKSLVSKMRKGERQWTEKNKRRAAAALDVPVAVAFVMVEIEGHRAGQGETDHLVQAGGRDASPPPVFK